MTNETDSFVNEVQDSLRQDRTLAIAKRYGPYLIALFVVFLAVIGGWQWWQGEQVNRERAASDELVAALEMGAAGNLDGAKAELERLSGEGPRTYRAMARMQNAALLQSQGDLDAALAEFDEAAEAAANPTMRDTARLRAAYIAAETQDFAALQTRLQPLIDSESRLAFLARELLAVEAWEAGETEIARSTLENLTLAFDAPETVRQRAQLALSVIGPAPAAPADGAPAPAPSEGEN
ncbi:MAG: tetratricopeptide repeat protein [Phycisphaerales bacterium]|nr:tetratricopeptide repeat protein [Hyphomonadaceae bacterium]